MSQSNAIFAYLFVAFLVFITMRGKLPKYLGFLLGTPTPDPLKTAAPAASGSGASNPLGEIFGTAAKLALGAVI